jgi:hypothetical protein
LVTVGPVTVETALASEVEEPAVVPVEVAPAAVDVLLPVIVPVVVVTDFVTVSGTPVVVDDISVGDWVFNCPLNPADAMTTALPLKRLIEV